MNENSPGKLLLVEDNPEDLGWVLRALRKANINHRTGVMERDGVDSLDFIFGENPSASPPTGSYLKAILLDLKLPKLDGLNGFKDARASRTIPAIAPYVVEEAKRPPRELSPQQGSFCGQARAGGQGRAPRVRVRALQAISQPSAKSDR